MSNIILEIPDQYDVVVLQAMKLLANNQLNIRLKGDTHKTLQKFTFADKTLDETNSEFVKRAFSTTIRTLVRLANLHNDKIRFNNWRISSRLLDT